MKKAAKQILLPQTEAEYDSLVASVVKKFKLVDAHHASALIASAIQHLPPDNPYTTLEYLGGYVQKNIAYCIARHKSNILQHTAQVDQLRAMIEQNPLDQKAWDALEKAKTEGSEYAKAAIEQIHAKEPLPGNVAVLK